MIAKSYDNMGLKELRQISIEKYKELEQQIEEETKDMIVTKEYNTNLDEIIDKIVENPREFYIKIAEVLSIEEREYLKQVIENKSCMNCSNGTCKVETSEKLDNEICAAWDNKELIGREKVLFKTR